MIGTAHYYGNPFIGIFAKANETLAFVPKGSSPAFLNPIKEHLGVDIIETSINGSNIVGIYLAMNKDFVVIPNILSKDEEKEIKDSGLDVIVANDIHNAWGNNLSINSKGGVINDEISKKTADYLEDCLGIELLPLRLEKYVTMGSTILATEKGFAVKNNASEHEIKLIETALKVTGGIATANLGNMFISACALANSKGLVMGNQTTGIESARLQDALNLL